MRSIKVLFSAICVRIVLFSLFFAFSSLYAERLNSVETFFSPFDDVEKKVMEVLDEAKAEVVIAHYSIRYLPIRDKLIELHKRGVDVKIVIDKQNAKKGYNTVDDELESVGIKIVRTKPLGDSIMHLKTCVIDNKIVMTGSYNWDTAAMVANDENMVLIRDAKIAAVYKNEVLEIMESEKNRALGEKVSHVIAGENVKDNVSIYFSPETNLSKKIQDEIKKAKKSVEIAMFTFTQKDIANSVITAAERNIDDVTVIMEQKQTWFTWVDEAFENTAKERTNFNFVRAENKLAGHSAMHNKFCIIDGETVITGASNWAKSGTAKPNEDIIIIKDKNVAKAYKQRFADLMAIYGGKSKLAEGETVREKAPILFAVDNENASPEDKVVLVGNTPELGNWDIDKGLVMSANYNTRWYVNTWIPSGKYLEYKFVTIKKDGSIKWENKQNRTFDVPDNGRASVLVSQYGNVHKTTRPGVDFRKTVVFIYGKTEPGQDMFIRGGIDHTFANRVLGKNCSENNFECAIPIRYLNNRNQTTNPWKTGDSYLDWYGTESEQNLDAEGTVLDWTTNNWPSEWGDSKTYGRDGFGITPYNTYGMHYWMMEVEMDCSKTVNGWFELKSYISNGPGWEKDVKQGGDAPYFSGNHFARCGKVNVFQRNNSSVIIERL